MQELRAVRRCDADVREDAAVAAGLRVLVVDDVRLYRESLASILLREPDVAQVRTALDLPTATAALRVELPDLALVNLGTPACRELLLAIRAHAPAVRLIVIGISESEEEVLACAEAGVHGYLLRSEPLEHLLRLMRTVAAGGTLCTPRISALLLRRVETLSAECRRSTRRVPVLTAREDQVLGLLDLGLSNQEIADRLGIEVRTVKNHVHHILEKVGARRRGEAVAAFRRLRGE
jgi:DNA-binding NarL/FixJ family response regulator